MRRERAVFAVCVVCAFAASHALPPVENGHNTRSFRNALNQQGFQTILQSIEERLRNLDQVYSLRYSKNDATGSTPTVDQLISRRLDSLESKLARLESIVAVQLDKMSESISSMSFKDEMIKDQIARKIDSVYDRLSNKINYIEGKIDMDVLKLQSKIETATSKLDRMEHSINIRQSDIETEITDGIVLMEDLKTSLATLETKLTNTTRKILETNHKKDTDAVNNMLANLTENISNITSNCKSFSGSSAEHRTIEKIDRVEDKLSDYSNKMTNLYSDVWKKSDNIEANINLTNTNIKELKNVLNKMSTHSVNSNRGSQNEGVLEMIAESFGGLVQRKFSEMGRKFDSNFQNIMLAQNLFLESCHRIQMDETQLEHKISLVLEKLLDSFTNKTSQTFKEIRTVEEMLKEHDEHVFRSISQNTNTILKLSEKTTEDRKRVEKILSTIKQEIANVLVNIQETSNYEHEDSVQYFNSISNILQKFQHQIDNLSLKLKERTSENNQTNIEEIKININNFLTEYLAEHNRTFHSNAFFAIENMMRNIYYNLNSIEMKLNKSYLDYYISRMNHPVNTHRLTDIKQPNNTDTNDTGYDVFLEIFPDNKTHDKIDESVVLNEKQNISYLKRFNYTLLKTEESEDAVGNATENTTQIINVTDTNNHTVTTTENLNATYIDSLEDTELRNNDDLYDVNQDYEFDDRDID